MEEIMTYETELVDFCRSTTAQALSKTKNPNILEWKSKIISSTQFLDSTLPEVFMVNRIYCIENDIYECPTCKSCENACGFFSADNKKGFNEYCSKECRQHSTGNPVGVDEKLSDYAWMFEHRITKRMSALSIGEILGISEVPVAKWCKKHKFPKTKYNASHSVVQEFLDDFDWVFKKYKIDKLSLRDIADEIGSSMATVAIAVKKHGIEPNKGNEYDRKFHKQSLGELELREFIRSIYHGEILVGKKNLLQDTRDIDIHIPELNIAFEYNGVYRHRYNPNGNSYSAKKDSTYHISKTNICASQGVELIQIWSSSWLTKKEIWKSRIRAKFGIIKSRIYARKCTIKEISTGIKNTFLDKNHIQGRDKSGTKLGLFHDDELVSVMTFAKSRYNKCAEWELVRFATKLDTIVIGGFSKLLNHYRKSNVGSIISYADRMHSNGNVYVKNGFSLLKQNPAGYHYFKKNTEILLNRQNFYKSKIQNGKDDVRTEFEIMTDNGYMWVYDCGTIAFILN
jgi:hypothetical protein